ncbi:MAG: hypothetical protein M1817_001354 [Caeruleum heppii]|nr:MAG: hypothetical protein M1817_001354 [Caeruleum heppii]
MEKYSQFRDRGSGIAPFFPIPSQSSGLHLPLHLFIFILRLPLFITVLIVYFLLLQWIPLGSLSKKALLWLILGVPGIWWVDLQIDGVKKGSLARHHALRLPQPGNIIASSFTSPIDSLYLAAIFDPIFTASYPATRQVHRISLWTAIMRAFRTPLVQPSLSAKMVDLRTLVRKHPNRIIVVFPECTTTNGRGILQFSPSLLSSPPGAKIFPISLRYSPSDITTPVPDSYGKFLWNLLSSPTHCIRVRIAECVYNAGGAQRPSSPVVKTIEKGGNSTANNGYSTNFFDNFSDQDTAPRKSGELVVDRDRSSSVSTTDEDEVMAGKKVQEKTAEALARLGRVKRVGLSVGDKVAFVEAWARRNARR